MDKKLNLSTEKGCRKTLAILLCIVLLASLFAQLISTNFGSVKISTLTIDSRGAELDIDLYVKRNVSDSDKLPCVLLAHGRGATKNVVRGLAEDLAKRGYVVLNVNAYGMGMSEQPVSDETGNGADHFNFGDSPFGMIDALNFARTLKYVDQTRIAMFGHSYGSSRISVAAAMDCGYFTLNDKKINILSDIFGLKFTEDEISQSADKLAEERLDDGQFEYYLSLADQAEKESSTRINTLVLTGATGGPAPATVTVGGHDVTRECQVNVTFVNGKYDSLGAGAMWSKDGTQTVLGDPKPMDVWFNSENNGASYHEIGKLGETTLENSNELKEAISNRTARIVCYNNESHSKNYFSNATNADTAAILKETLNTPDSTSGNSTWLIRACFNCVAMLAMLMSIVVLTHLLLKKPFFSSCIAEKTTTETFLKKPEETILSILSVILTVLALYKANSGGPVWANPFGTRILPNVLRLVTTSAIAVWFVIWLAVASLIIVTIKVVLEKKKSGKITLFKDCFGIKISGILKSLLLGAIVIAFAYLQLIIIMYLFNQDFRFWQMMFSEMKAEHWLVALPYVILFLPCYLCIGCAINYSSGNSLNPRKDMAKTIFVNSIGVWGLCLFCFIMWFVNWKGAAISDFTLSYSMLLFVPVTVFITRKMYKTTNNVWIGAIINSILLAWSLVCSAGIADKYYGQNLISVLFNV